MMKDNMMMECVKKLCVVPLPCAQLKTQVGEKSKSLAIVDCSSTDVWSFQTFEMYQTYVATSQRFGEKPACRKGDMSSESCRSSCWTTYVEYT
eukprot:4120078-Ditylum_brightwellii.AAC.1